MIPQSCKSLPLVSLFLVTHFCLQFTRRIRSYVCKFTIFCSYRTSHNLISVASVCGIAGAIISMAQEWYIGPVAAMLSPLGGGDMGFEFAAVFAGVVYPPLRWLEIRKWGR